MANPALLEVWRGGRIESVHRGAIAVVDADGARVLALGDIAQPVFPRSAVKAFQALPLIETGAADHHGLDNRELAIACGSHGGEPTHVAAVEGMLGRLRLDASALECGAHWPSHQPSSHALIRAGRAPSAVHNNCSGKHAGFLCVACRLGVEHRGYGAPAHPVQRLVKEAMEGLAGVALAEDTCAIDGCSVPTWAMPVENLARAFAGFGTGQGLAPERARAVARLRAACAAEPYYVAGTGRFATVVMERLRERAFVKTGAEGVFCGAIPGQGLGIAVKIDDGAGRASEAVMAALLIRLMRPEDEVHKLLRNFAEPVLRNWNGREVGGLRPSEAVLPAS
jgi:L-asparaginase II